MHNRLRPGIGMIALAALTLLMGGCAAQPGISSGGYRALDSQQQGTCDGIPAPRSLSLLPSSASVTAAVMCVDTAKYVAGQGMWTFAQILPLDAADLPKLVAGLTGPDVEDYRGPCTDNLLLVAAFVVTLSDGSRIRPGVPGDGCHPQQDALQAFGDPTARRPSSETKTVRILGELETVSDCGDGAKSPAIWMSGATLAQGRATLPASGSVSICSYRATANQEGELSKVGIIPVEQLRALWQQIPTGAVSSCPQPSDVMTLPAVDWLMFLPTPQPPYQAGGSGAGPIAELELGGCRRMFGVAGGVVTEVSPALGNQLLALAHRAVS